MSGLGLWNPDTEEGLDMFGLGADISSQSLWNPSRGLDMSSLTGVFGGIIVF
jgi:hypothetical protein